MALIELSSFFKKAQSLKHLPELSRVYLVGGDDVYLKREIYSLLKQRLKPENFEFNYFNFELERSEIDAIELEIKSYPMMADFRLVTVEVSQITPEPKLKSFCHFIESMSFYDTYVVINFEKADLKKSYFKNLIQQFDCVECKTPYSNQVTTWIQQIAQKYGLKFRDEALALFHTRVGESLAYIDLEVQKLQGFSDSGWVTASLVNNLIKPSGDAQLFESIRFFYSRNILRSIHAFQYLLRSGESPVLIVSLLARQARLLLKVYIGYNANLQGPKLAQYLKVPHYFLKQYESEAKLWSMNSLIHLISSLSDLDIRLKTKSQDSTELILNWTIKQSQIHDR